MTTVAPRVLAFYLPQFHPIPENDRWWGPGFTEWTNVKRAYPMFDGHVQPDGPGELGYYDLRSADVRKAQADLARAHGISGFCYYHYWFNGQRLLEHVVDAVLSEGEPDFPFCLCWANESWTRTWDGLERDVLIGQTYGAEDDRAHIRWLARAFQDPRYIRIGGRPLLLVYRAHHLPSPLRTTTIWREEAQRLGLGELDLCSVESLPWDRLDPTRIGFDAAVEFQPDWERLGAPAAALPGNSHAFDYATTVERMLAKPPAPYLRYPCVTPGWDNSPRRRERAVVLTNSSPELYGRWLQTAVARTLAPTSDENLVFINAWNEWGEGAHLEPSARWGRAYLEQTRDVIAHAGVRVWTPPSRPARAAAPRVTVALPTYNGAAHVEAAISSVLSQTFENFELIVIDDASDDETPAIAARVQDPRVRVERNPVRLGMVRNWNRCLEAATGTYVTIFHQDDLMAPDNLARKIAALDAHPAVAFVHSNVRQIGVDGTVLSESWYDPPALEDAGVHKGRTFLERLFWGNNVVCCPSVMLRRDMVSGQDGFDTQLPFTADWEMWMRLCVFHDVAYLPETLLSYRRHHGAETERFRDAAGFEQFFLAKHRLLTRCGSHLPAEDWRARLTDMYGREAVRLAGAALAEGDRTRGTVLLRLATSFRAYGADTHHGDLDQAIELLVRLYDDTPRTDEEAISLARRHRELEAEAQALTTRHRALEDRSQQLETELRGREGEITALKSSSSWRLTSPLRFAFRLLTGRPN